MKNYLTTLAVTMLVSCGGGDSDTPAQQSSGGNAMQTTELQDGGTTQTPVMAQALIGTWVFCTEALPNDENIVSNAATIVFQPDGNRSNGISQYVLPSCDGDPVTEFIDTPTEYVVNGTATTSEGLSVFEVVYLGDTTYYHIDGPMLYIAEDIVGVGIVIALTAPYIKQ